MSQIKWATLSIAHGATEAEFIKGFLETQGITAVSFQAGDPYFPATEILVPDFQLETAQNLLRARGWKTGSDE